MLYTLYRRLRNEGEAGLFRLKAHAQSINEGTTDIALEHCFYVETTKRLSKREISKLYRILRETFDPKGLSTDSFLSEFATVIEIGPRLNFPTSKSSIA